VALGDRQDGARVRLVGLREVSGVGVHLEVLAAEPGHGAARVQTPGKGDSKAGASFGQRAINAAHGCRLPTMPAAAGHLPTSGLQRIWGGRAGRARLTCTLSPKFG